MHSFKLAGLELRRLTGERMARAALVVIALVPLLYGVLYLWAFWDPYTMLDQLPVALVNADRPVTVDGTRISAGADLTDELIKRGTFGWHRVSLAQAEKGLRQGTYYMALEIPEGFSANLGTANTAHPVRARLRVVDHESANMLATQIGGRVFTEVRAAAGASASRGYLDKIFVGFSDARGGLVDAAAGAGDLASGLAEARDGAARLAAGEHAAAGGASTLASGVRTLHGGAVKADGGARAVAQGTKSLSAGLGSAREGASALSDGAVTLASGADALAAGSKQLAAGGETLDTSAARLAQGAAQLDAGVGAAVAQIDTAVEGSAQVRDGAAGVDALLHAYVAAHPEVGSDPTFAKALGTASAVKSGSAQLAGGLAAAQSSAPTLKDGATQVAQGADELGGGAHRLASGLTASREGTLRLADGAWALASGSDRLERGVDAAAAGSRTLAAGASSLAGGTARLAAGADDAATGADSLASGLARLDDGATTLAQGLTPAAAGSSELEDGLTAGAEALPAFSAGERSANAKMMADPVALDTKRMDAVPNYGTGFAPYFIPLALWVGALMAYFIVRPLPERALANGASPVAAALAGYWPAAGIGVVQAVVLVAVLRFALGLSPVAPVALYGFTILSALSFIAVLQFLSAALGSAIGKIASIVLLMLQLTSSAGTFPLETVPGFFRAINPFLPMTYVVAGLRQAISGGDSRALLLNAGVLACFAALALAGTVLTARRKEIWTMERLRPVFEL